MRRTVILDPDVEALLRRDMEERGLTLREALNDAARRGLAGGISETRRGRFPQQTYSMEFRPGRPPDKALAIADEGEDAELLRRMSKVK